MNDLLKRQFNEITFTLNFTYTHTTYSIEPSSNAYMLTTHCCLRTATRAMLLDTTSKLLTSAEGREHVRKYSIKDRGFLGGNPASRNHCILLKYSASVQQLSCILHHSLLSHNLQVEWEDILPSSHGKCVFQSQTLCATTPG